MKTYGGFLISQIRQLSGRVFEKTLKESGVDAFNGPQGRILYVLWERQNVSISEISKLTSLANTTLTSMLERMEQHELIERVPDPNDRRKIIISITPKAKELKPTYDAVSEKTNEIFYAGFTEKEINKFENTLRRILKNYEEAIENDK